MPPDTADILERSSDADEIGQTAFLLAHGARPADHELLLRFLQSPEFLARLDSDEEYQLAASTRLRVEAVLEALRDNKAPSAHATLVALTQTPAFIRQSDRVEMLIEACAVVRPPPAEVIKFWDDHSQPDDGYTFVTIPALVENGSEPALELLEKKLADARHPEEDRLSWMRSDILAHRNDLTLLQSCARLLRGGLPRELRPALVEVLFDYRPDEWYLAGCEYEPPDRARASRAALAALRKIGQYALQNVELSDAQRQAVETTLAQIRER